jgi:hypothetical protein
MHFQRLNGWQRVFVVLSVTWLIPTAWIVADDFPTHSKVREKAQQTTIEALRNRQQEQEKIDSSCKNIGGEDMVSYGRCLSFHNGTQGLSIDETRSVIQSKNSKFWSDITEVQDRIFAEDLAQLPQEQVRAIWTGFLLWALPLLAIYAFGLGVAWIRLGFRR